MEDIIDIIVTETTNLIEITSQPTDEIIDVNIIDNREDVTLNVTPTLVEININSLTGNFGVNWGEIDGTLSNQTDLQNTLNLKADLVDGKVPSSQLPSYVDDVVEVANYAALPVTGEVGKIYITLDTNYIYRWTGSVYVEIKDSSAVWGAITGTLSNQTDLQTALNGKMPTITFYTPLYIASGGEVNIRQSNSIQDGYLSSTDWNTFNGKQAALSGTGFVKISGTTISYDNSTYALDSAVVKLAGTQTITGDKGFTAAPTFDSGAGFKNPSGLYNYITATDTGWKMPVNFNKEHIFVLSTSTAYTYTFPSATGTLALTSDLSSYLPLSGGTLTGALSGTSASFSGSITNAGSIFTTNDSIFSTPGSITKHSTVGLVLRGVTADVFDFAIYSASGSVLINNPVGTTNLGFGGAATFSSDLTLGGNESYLYFNSTYSVGSNSRAKIRTVGAGGGSGYGGDLRFSTRTPSNAWNEDAMIINSSGNVGIGTTSPSVKLHIQNSGENLRLQGVSSGNAVFQTWFDYVGNRRGYIGYGTGGSSQLDFSNEENGSMTFLTNATERMRITSGGILEFTGSATGLAGAYILNDNTSLKIHSTNGGGTTKDLILQSGGSAGAPQLILKAGGNVLIGTTSNTSASIATNGSLQVNKEIMSVGSTAGLFWENRSGGVTSNSNWYGWYTTSGTIYLFNGTSNVASISPSTGIYMALSDKNKKKDFEVSNIGLAEVMKLKPTLYRMKSDSDTDSKQLGFLAQEVKEVLPQAYVQTKTENEDFVGLNFNPIVAALTKAVQELKAELDTLKNK